ncbi:MAG: alpha/beta hydrolase [Balneolaceae bacterium]|nr:alpha/beta hydrolase [Balneolaceae bacterium]
MLKKMIISLALTLGISLIVIAFGVRGAFYPFTNPIQNSNDNSENITVSELIKIELGGMDQYILLRGANRSNPVLLWLHGGPGAAQMPLAHHLDKKLEQEFIVVHWDQRGAGKSNHRHFDESTMTFNQFMRDAHELIRYLQTRFDQDKIFLLGHSWGSQLGIELAAKFADDFHAYISVSQVVDNYRSYEIAHKWLTDQAHQTANQAILERLKELGKPPYTKHRNHVQFAGLIGDHGGNFDISLGKLARIALRAPEYSLTDYYRWLNGANRGSGPMWKEIYKHQINYIGQIPELEIPVYFLAGLHDYNTPYELIHEYFDMIEAPQKDLILFDQSAHTPFLGEPETFTEELFRIKQLYVEKREG